MKKGGRETMNNDWTNDIRRLMDGYEVKAPDGLLDDVKKRMAASLQEQSRVVSSQQEPGVVSSQQEPGVVSSQKEPGVVSSQKEPGVVSSQQEKASRNKAKVTPLWHYRWAAAAAIAVIAVPIFWKLMSDRQELAPASGSQEPTVASVSHRPAASTTDPGSAASSADQAATASSNGYGSAAPSSSFLAALSTASGSPLAGQPSASGSRLTAQVSTEGSPLVAQVSAEGSPVEGQGPVGRNNVAANKQEKQEKQEKRLAKRPSRHGNLEPLDSYALAYEPSSRDRGNAFSVGAYYGGAVGSNSGSGPAMPFIASEATPYGVYDADMATGYLKMEEPKRKAHHKQPVKAGVSVSYKINKRWSVQSGVTYSYLSSDFDDERGQKETQKLHYVGIPLTASYNIVSGKKAEVYVTAGGEAEKLVKGKMTTEDREERDVKEHRPQWSVKAAVGGAYHFTPTLSVYVEPGLSHHFDNHSDVENVYKDKKTNFSLNVGFRVNLNK